MTNIDMTNIMIVSASHCGSQKETGKKIKFCLPHHYSFFYGPIIETVAVTYVMDIEIYLEYKDLISMSGQP